MKHPAAVSLALLTLTLTGRTQGFDPPHAVDVNPSPLIDEFDLAAAEITDWEYFPLTMPGVTTTVWAYGDLSTGVYSVPGPVLDVTIGNTVVVNFTNNLPEETTVHWHGVETPASMDGSHISQPLIQPGETFRYEFPATEAAFYWYHPHVRPYDQVEKGLYGGFVVRDPLEDARLGLDQLEEHLIFFDDVLLDAGFQVVPAFSFRDPLQNALYQVNGREGNYVLINGRESGNVNLQVPNGKPQRWRVVNCANTTFCRLDVQNPNAFPMTDLWDLGGDQGLLEAPYLKPRPVTSTAPTLEHPKQVLVNEMGQGILLLPGERYDVAFTPLGEDGQVFEVWQWDWFRGRHAAVYGRSNEIVLIDDPLDGAYPTTVAFTLQVIGSGQGAQMWAPPRNWSEVVQYPPPDPVVGSIPALFGHSDPSSTGDITFFAQGTVSSGVVSGLPTSKIDSFNAHDVHVGETWVWQVTNLTHGDHNFHTHGFDFELIEWRWEDDLDPTNPLINVTFSPFDRRIKDTVRIPARLGAKGTSRSITTLRVEFDDSQRPGEASAMGMLPTYAPDGSWTSGGWVFHCHVLEHSARGMLSVLEVHEPDELYTLLGKQKPGTGGSYPSILASGDLTQGEDVTVQLTDALPGKKLWLVIGDEAGFRSVAGGTLVPVTSNANAGSPFLGVQSGFADGNGDFTWLLNGWNQFPSGTTLYLQAAARDPGGVGKLAFSNALSFTVP